MFNRNLLKNIAQINAKLALVGPISGKRFEFKRNAAVCEIVSEMV
jgi:hypothetical protein